MKDRRKGQQRKERCILKMNEYNALEYGKKEINYLINLNLPHVVTGIVFFYLPKLK